VSAAAATVADGERSQAAWLSACAVADGGAAWEDEGLRWAWEPGSGHLWLLFPRAIAPAALARGVAFAGARGVRRIGAWLDLETDPEPLSAAGFERGWAPWWMAAPLAAVAAPADPRVALEDDTAEYDAHGRALLGLTAARPRCTWHAAARLDGRLVGRAWSHVTGALAGVYDTDVWPAFQRQGLGTGLLRAVCAPARTAGARVAVLNATPAGERLYAAHGFTRVGDGITWWLHR
jgi:GNAT superfamily N-acetyltransferase